MNESILEVTNDFDKPGENRVGAGWPKTNNGSVGGSATNGSMSLITL